MDAKAEARAEEDKTRRAEEFRVTHAIPEEEWKRADEIASAFLRELHDNFWKLWEEANSDVKS